LETNGNVKRNDVMNLSQFRKAVIERDKRCRLCGDEGQEVHHIFGRRWMATRCDPDNGIFLCVKCHKWCHDNIESFRTLLKQWHGEEWFDNLERKAKKGTK